MDIIDIARANFTILDLGARGIDSTTILLVIFWGLAGLAAGARSRRMGKGVISGLLGSIFIVLLVTVGGIFLDSLATESAIPPIIGIISGMGTATIFGGLGGKITSAPAKSMLKDNASKRKIWTKEDKWVCPNCEAAIPPGAFVCPTCGADVIE